MKKIAILLPLLLSFTLLQGCHSSSTNNQSTVRLVNGTTTKLDMYWSATAAVSAVASNIDYGSASSSVTSGSGVSTIQLATTGNSASGGATFSFTGGTSYTMLAYPSYTPGPSGSVYGLEVLQLIDNQTAPTSGNALVGIVDRSGAGSLDVYIAANTSIPSGTWAPAISGTIRYTTLPLTTLSGTTPYHIQVTGAGAGYGHDVRLDIPAVLIGNQQILSLVLTPTTGGALVDGLVFFQQGQTLLPSQKFVTSYKNGSVRVRIAANNGSAITAATTNANGTTPILASDLSDANVSSYMVVPLNGSTTSASPQAPGVSATSLPLSLTVNGVAVATSAAVPATAVPGADLTLLAYGASYALLNDDNTLASSGYAKLRLVNAINGVAPAVSLTYGGVGVANAQNIVAGAQTTATNLLLPGGSSYAIGVTGNGVTYSPGSPTLVSQGVYTLFMLSNTVGVVNSDHSFQGP
jgi:hypothetical protein